MPYLIDGHNLIGQLPDISLDDPNDEALLVQKLISFTARTKKRCIVVFDQGLPGGESRLSTSKVKVIFASAQHSTADRVMMRRIANTRDPGGWTVVSSDNAVLEAARRQRMKILRSPEFARLLRRPTTLAREEADNVHVSPDEIDYWLGQFGEEE